MKTEKFEKGFTLIEILASISLITIIIIAISTFLINYANFTKILENKLTSVHVAEEIVTLIKNNDELAQLLNRTNEYNTGCSIPKQVPLSEIPSVSNVYEVNNGQYKPTISICQSPDEEELDLYRVKVNIIDINGNDQASLFTYFHLIGSETE